MEKARILIVDDEAIIAMEMENSLKTMGYVVSSIVDTGQKAIEKAEEDKPDLILMDIRINGEMDGIDTARVIRSRFGIPVIFSTAYLDEERIERAKITMPFGYILKPIQKRDLKVTIEMALYVSKVDAERRKAERKAIQFGQILDDSLNEIYIFDSLTLKFTQVNQGARRNLQYSMEELQEMTPLDIKPEFTEEAFNKLVEPLRRNQGGTTKFHTVHRRKDATLYPVEVNLQLLSFEDESMFVAIINDITERKQAEEELLKSEEKYRELVESSNSIILIFDSNYTITLMNRYGQEFFGFTEEEIVGKRVTETILPIHESTGRDLEKMIEDMVENPMSFIDNENENIRKNGERVWITWRNKCFYDDTGRFSSMLCTGYDITEKKELEQKKQQEMERMETILSAQNTGLSLINPDMSIAWVNEKTREMFPGSEPVGQLCYVFFENSDTICDNCQTQKAFITGEVCENEQPVPATGRCYHIIAQPIKDSFGNVVNVLEGITDITESKQAEEEKKKLEAMLLQSQKIEAIGTLASGIAHDFNNILAAIFGYTQLSKRKLSDTAENRIIEEYLDKIFLAGMRAKDLIDQILTFSRKGDYDPRIVDLQILAKETVKFLKAALSTAITIRLNTDPELKHVFGDATQIQQVIMNLCTNAFHAMEEKGGGLEIDIANYSIKQKAVNTGNLDPGEYVLLTVSDSGKGMDDKTKQRIFEPFFTTKENGKGTGLGLSVVHGIVSRHGGAVRVYTQAGLGTKFAVYLPTSSEDIITKEKENELVLPTGSESILFVDDEIELGAVYSEMLRSQGYIVRALSSSREALEEFMKSPESFDLIITDYGMPEMSGMELGREIRKQKPMIPIILISGLRQQIPDEELELAGIAARYSKPIQFDTLIQGVREVLDHR